MLGSQTRGSWMRRTRFAKLRPATTLQAPISPLSSSALDNARLSSVASASHCRSLSLSIGKHDHGRRQREMVGIIARMRQG